MALGTGVYGTNATNAVNYNAQHIGIKVITANEWNEFMAAINVERARRGATAVANVAIRSAVISHNDFNALRDALLIPGPAASQAYATSGTATITTYPQAPAVTPTSTAASRGDNITLASINKLIDDFNTAGLACTCNCNYCSCNCNYCTCNCNYACTCNCNYSDERLKENIEHIDTVDGLNVYSYTYVWNKTKKYSGVMAQELVGTQFESALYTDANGYYTVDYSKLPVEFKEI